jgi:hypothetical protein
VQLAGSLLTRRCVSSLIPSFITAPYADIGSQNLFVFFRLDPLVRVCTVHTHNEREKKPKQQQTQTHKSPAGQSVVSFDQNLEATTTATTRHALDAQTTENVLSGFFF